MIYFINQVLKSKTYVYIAIKKEINKFFTKTIFYWKCSAGQSSIQTGSLYCNMAEGGVCDC